MHAREHLALIVISALRKTAQSSELLKNMTVREIMESMETLVQVKCEKRYGKIFTEIKPLQRKIIDIFTLNVKT